MKLLRDGEEFDDPMELKVGQITPRAVSTIFAVDIETVWLKEQYGQRAFFPNMDKTSFELCQADDIDCVIVMGAPAVSGYMNSQPCSSTSTPVLSATSSSSVPVRPVFSRKAGAGISVNVKVVQAIVSKSSAGHGKIEFTKIAQTYIPVRELNANVPYVTSVAQQHWGTNYVLVTADGLRLEDSPGTQGLAFWRVGSRKIFAVREELLAKMGNKGKVGKGKQKQQVINIFSSDEDEAALLVPPNKKPKLSVVMNEIKSLKTSVDDAMKVTKGMPLPPGLYRLLDQTFQCRICHSSPLKLPPIFARCCRNILGCGECVDNWFKNESTCPLCRSDRALPGTCIVNGLDEFIESVDSLLSCPNEFPNASCTNPVVPSPPRRSQLPATLDFDSD